MDEMNDSDFDARIRRLLGDAGNAQRGEGWVDSGAASSGPRWAVLGVVVAYVLIVDHLQF